MAILETIKQIQSEKQYKKLLPLMDRYFETRNRQTFLEFQKEKRINYQQNENKAWFSDKKEIIEAFYKYRLGVLPDSLQLYNKTEFWRVVTDNVVKSHYPLPGTISTAMANLIFNKAPDIYCGENNELETEIITKSLKENDEIRFFQQAAMFASYSGTVACKIIMDTNFSDYPIMQNYPAEDVEFTTKHGKVIEIIFIDRYKYNEHDYYLKSVYGYGYINYYLYNDAGKNIDIKSIPDTQDLKDIIFVGSDGMPIPVLMAVYMPNKSANTEYGDSPYGESDYSGIIDNFQGIDEVFSAREDLIRKSHIKTFVTNEQCLKTRDGDVIPPNSFDVDTVILTDRSTDKDQKFERSYLDLKEQLNSYNETLNNIIKASLARVGLSPNTVIENISGANSSAKALEIREGVSERTREAKISLFTEYIKKLACLILIYNSLGKATSDSTKDYNIFYVDEKLKDFEVNVVFPPYVIEKPEDRLPLIIQALDKGLIDRETAIDRLWGKEYNEDQKQAMLKNIIGLIDSNIEDDENKKNDLISQ